MGAVAIDATLVIHCQKKPLRFANPTMQYYLEQLETKI